MFGEVYMLVKLLIMQSDSASHHFLPPRYKYSHHIVLTYFQSMFFLSVRYQVSHLYKTRDKIIVLHILIFSFYGGGRKQKILN